MNEVARSDQGLEQLPLAVDLDGTLHRGDLSWWTLYTAFWLNPVAALRAIWRKPRAEAKAHLVEIVLKHFDPDDMKWIKDFESWVDQQAATGRTIVLASGSDQTLVDRVAADLGYFEGAFGSDGRTINLTGEDKATKLNALFPDGYVYAGNSQQDWPVWSAARGAILVNCPGSVERRAKQAFAIEAVFSRSSLK